MHIVCIVCRCLCRGRKWNTSDERNCSFIRTVLFFTVLVILYLKMSLCGIFLLIIWKNTGCRNLHPGQKELQKEVLRQRKTLYTIPEVYQTVIPYFEIIDGKCVKTELLPVSLGFYKERYKKNLPYVADEIEALAILEYLNRACRPYGVEWCYSGGIMIRSK